MDLGPGPQIRRHQPPAACLRLKGNVLRTVPPSALRTRRGRSRQGGPWNSPRGRLGPSVPRPRAVRRGSWLMAPPSSTASPPGPGDRAQVVQVDVPAGTLTPAARGVSPMDPGCMSACWSPGPAAQAARPASWTGVPVVSTNCPLQEACNRSATDMANVLPTRSTCDRPTIATEMAHDKGVCVHSNACLPCGHMAAKLPSQPRDRGSSPRGVLLRGSRATAKAVAPFPRWPREGRLRQRSWAFLRLRGRGDGEASQGLLPWLSTLAPAGAGHPESPGIVAA